jgi:hypothetical protein
MQAQEAAANRQMAASQFVLGQQGEAANIYQGPKGSIVGAGLDSAGSGLTTMAMLQKMGLFKNTSMGNV